MGLSIHYSGTIDRTEDIPRFIEELTDIAGSMDWTVKSVNGDEADPRFRGIILTPKGDCEPLCFIFDREGRLRRLVDLLNAQVEPTEYSFSTATKTQFTEVGTHVWIIGLLRYLKKRYLSNLQVSDEGEYWETEDLEKLCQKKQFLQGMIDQLAGRLSESEPLPEGASIDDIIARIEAIVKKRPRDPGV